MKKRMTISKCMLLVLALLASPSQAAFPNLTRIYRFTGIISIPSQGTGIQMNQTVIQCTNWSVNPVQVQIIIYDGAGTTIAGPVYPLNLRQTFTAVTNTLSNGPSFGIDHDRARVVNLGDGSMEIRATNPRVHCNVKRVWVFFNYLPSDQRNVAMVSIDTLNGVRYNQEVSGDVQE
jgi:hypothetical protein